MSKEIFAQFRDAVMKSSSLQAELVDTVKSQADLLAMGKRLGFELEAADLQSAELTEEELKQAAGGQWTFIGHHKDWITVSTFNAIVSVLPK